MTSTVLLVHFEQRLRDSARAALELAGHRVKEADEVTRAWKVCEADQPDLILLPWAASRLIREWLDRLRDQAKTRQTRAIVWAFRPDMREAVNSLEFGADDCLSIPFDDVELIARVNSCLRRPPASNRPDQLIAGPLVLDKGVHCLLVNDRPVDLAPTEFRLLSFFLENQGRVHSRAELVRRAWSKEMNANHRTVDVHVRRLRQVLEPFGYDDMIQTVRGFGYRFEKAMHKNAPQAQ